ncbi:LytR/AlgR family response regulator transcription factor [Vibrio genomosp. F10 str. 9ZC157]|uniref:DNA-binding response regulator n=1 Tax=Vibrio genomosp. F10 str. ZF-129 TaxID=1187848 RepID=A0A1E5BAC6_9VIBR|nr:LytTR family DNA-binding domain-containing protein [Vibrio genomosp. F10]OEE30859.1 DNA-binding response regulator [Vibrio genomosp. F10 str. ZF-129]OEE98052.1 DNA-binding response regulator [Vibrio genomosp. F10 str. 9ZC157]
MTRSMPVTAIIADDEPLLRHHFSKALAEHWPELDIVALAENGEQALEQIEKHQPDIVFLDINMPLQDGMSVAKTLATRQSKTKVVFITAYDEFAVQAFETSAVDYLLKPVSDMRLAQCVDKLKIQMQVQDSPEVSDVSSLIDQIQKMTLKAKPTYLTWIKAAKGDDIHLISLKDVLYFKAEDKYISLYKKDDKGCVEYLLRTSLKELLHQLDPDMFWQIHRSSVVNVSAIEKVKKDFSGRMFVHIGEAKLPVSRAMQPQFTNLW